MSARLVAPLFVFLLLLAGGSVQRPMLTLLVQLGAIGVLGWALWAPRRREQEREGRTPIFLLLATVALGLFQLVPLPPSLWAALPGRELVASGDAMLGLAGAWRPLSLDPGGTIGALLTLTVPAALFFAMLRRPQPASAWLVGGVISGTVASALLGIAQVIDGTRRLYLFPQADWSSASGFFANPNHLGSLLLVSIPLAVGLALQERGGATTRARRLSLYLVLGTLGISLLAVTPLNGSLAIAMLGGPVLLASAMIPSWGRREAWRRRCSAALLAAMAVGAAAIFVVRDHLLALGQTGFATRAEVWRPSLDAIGESFPAGTGFGSFAHYFRHFENDTTLGMAWVNHAHNDYLEVLLEGGLPGLALLLLFLAWWAIRAKTLWFREDGSAMGRAAVVASGVLLLHSLVDYPLRTPALAGLMGVLLAMMVLAVRPTPRRDEGDLWATRHWTVS